MMDYSIILILAVIGLFLWLIGSHDRDNRTKDESRSIGQKKKDLAEELERGSCNPSGGL